jgi:hypothetical protein
MNITTFVLASLPAIFSVVFLKLNKENIDCVLIKFECDYASKKNSISIVKVIKTLRNCSDLTKKEKKLLVLTIISLFVAQISVILWAILVLFFPYIILGK